MWYFTVGINDALNKLSIVTGHLCLLLFFVLGLINLVHAWISLHTYLISLLE